MRSAYLSRTPSTPPSGLRLPSQNHEPGVSLVAPRAVGRQTELTPEASALRLRDCATAKAPEEHSAPVPG